MIEKPGKIFNSTGDIIRLSDMNKIENNRAFAGELMHKVLGDEIVNYDEANTALNEVRDKPLILVHNHFGLPDGPHEVPNSFRFESIRNRRVTLAVTHYLYTYARILNKGFGLDLDLIGVVTPYMENRDKFRDKYAGRRGEGLIQFHRKAKRTLENNGVVEVNPQATRARGGMGEPGKENILMQSLLKISEKLNPYVVPVGLWVQGKKPEEVYGLNLHGYKVRYGKPVSAAEIKQLLIDSGETRAEDFKGADKLVYAMIRDLLPEDYR